MTERVPDTLYDALLQVWLVPFGLMVELITDQDTAFEGVFQGRLSQATELRAVSEKIGPHGDGHEDRLVGLLCGLE